ncbi:acyl-CoA thioesterase [Peribacillus frigoritolerans]|nr:acyl-CoA thioesterase [Peribacillus frigoritolerans]
MLKKGFPLSWINVNLLSYIVNLGGVLCMNWKSTSVFPKTDALGHINNTSYFVYLEEARMKFFEALGLATNVESWNFLLASTKCDFIAQGYFNQPLTIRTSLTKVGTKKAVIWSMISSVHKLGK